MASARPARLLAERYLKRLAQLERTRARVERLYASHRIGLREIEHIYGSLLMAAITGFEALLEELFLGLLVGRLAGRLRAHPRVQVKSDLVARELVLEGRSYVDWLPYDRWVNPRAERYFRGGL